MPDLNNRRQFLRFLAGSPALLAAQETTDLITSPDRAINVFDFEPVARNALPPAHWGFMATGVDDDNTVKANREGFSHLHLRPRRLINISKVDTRVEIFGTSWDSPIAIAPIGIQKTFHEEGELPVARAARSRSTLQILSTLSNTSFEDITATLGRQPWYQLFTTSRWEYTERLVKRVEVAGCKVMVLTVDTQAGRHMETLERSRRLDKRQCVTCHGTSPTDFYRHKPMFSGMDHQGLSVTNPAMTWEHVRQLRKMTNMKLLIKGIQTAEDAKLCIEHGIDGVIVSNHGGRAEESGRGSIDCLPEVLDGVSKRVPVIIDGGFRRGTDIFKALALGARAVCIGRPYVWGLAAFGQPGVERVIDLLRVELELVMKQCGVRSLAEMNRSYVGYIDGRA